MEIIGKVANDIDPMIKMTIDFPSNYADKKVPMLDIKVWKEEQIIYYQFYEKPTKNRFVISKDSAMPISKKIDTLSNEVFRRLHNTKHELEWQVKVEILEKYMAELMASGYTERDRHEILKSGIKRYENLRQKEEDGVRPFFRNRNFEKNKRKEDKENKRSNWFKNTTNRYKTVFFVPPTPGSKLLNMLKATENKFKIDDENRIKFVETGGQKYIDFYRNSNPFRESCKATGKCMISNDPESTADCKTTNVGYSIECKLCNDRGINITYEGESARNLHLRTGEHLRDLKNKSDKSVLYKHILNKHEDEKDDVKFRTKIVGKFKSCTNRQIEESIRIRNKHPSLLMNSKSEFYGPVIKRKVFET